MFDEHSFLDEIKDPASAKACYDYFVHNLGNYQQELYEAGLDYDETKNRIRQVWSNLVKSSKRVGFTNDHIEELATKYGI